jgi:hypothetical protein
MKRLDSIGSRRSKEVARRLKRAKYQEESALQSAGIGAAGHCQDRCRARICRECALTKETEGESDVYSAGACLIVRIDRL